jgi:carbon-monoxide dehydrogenase small subunit
MRITATINGAVRDLEVRTNQTLIELLRSDLHLMGTREGCGVGMCGSCTVLVDGDPVSSCIFLAYNIESREVTTIEGLAPPGQFDPVQEAFLEHQAFQCGYCTPGLILAVKALLASGDTTSEAAIRDYLSGNICRCGTYREVLAAVSSLLARQ